MRISPLALACFYFLVSLYVKGENNPSWVDKNVFGQKILIENKGQFFIEGKVSASEIKFGAVNNGLQYYFTKNSFIIEYVRLVRRSERELEELKELYEIKENDKKEEEEEFSYKHVKEYYQVKFLNSDSGTEIVAEEKQEFYHTYGFETNDTKKMSVKASAFKKLIYKNIYPNIDLEFYFPEDKPGYKYNFILHPGAKATDIKIKFENAEGISLIDNDIRINSTFGNFIEHKPQTFIKENELQVNAKYRINKNEVSFDIGEYDINKTLVIDPWVITPSIGAGNKAYDVDYDDAGNVYIYGGGRPGFKLSKYSPNGNLQWTYTCPALWDMYGDFAVDKRTGTCYVGEGLDFQASYYKVNTLGIQVGFYLGTSQLNEIGRIVFDKCTNIGYVIGGGSNSNAKARMAILDTSMTNMNYIAHASIADAADLNCLAIDSYGNTYETTNTGWTLFFNRIFKVPVSNLSTSLWNVKNGYNFYEYGSNAYYTNQTWVSNGYNGISVSDKILFTSNGSVLKSWRTSNGSLIDSLVMPILPSSINHWEVFWGGLASNDCGYVLAGNLKNVMLYDSNFNFIRSYPQPDTIFDIVLRNDGTAFVCGDSFLSVFKVNGINCINAIQSISQPDSCNDVGTATLNISGGTNPYAITWNTSPPQVGNIATNLMPGQNYFATITDNSCNRNTYVDTIKIINPYPYFSSVIVTSVTCGGVDDGKITIDCSGGLAPYNYSWSNGINGSGINSINGLSAGNYSVQVMDARNCPHSVSVIVPLIENFSFDNYPRVNVFTPNGDGINDQFFPIAKSVENFNSFFTLMERYELNIYDRWGLLVFSTSLPKDYWYGRTTSGVECVEGTYFWVLSINSSCQDPIKQTTSGFVQLIR